MKYCLPPLPLYTYNYRAHLQALCPSHDLEQTYCTINLSAMMEA